MVIIFYPILITYVNIKSSTKLHCLLEWQSTSKCCRAATLCDSVSLGSSARPRRWIWWLFKPSHCVSYLLSFSFQDIPIFIWQNGAILPIRHYTFWILGMILATLRTFASKNLVIALSIGSLWMSLIHTVLAATVKVMVHLAGVPNIKTKHARSETLPQSPILLAIISYLLMQRL